MAYKTFPTRSAPTQMTVIKQTFTMPAFDHAPSPKPFPSPAKDPNAKLIDACANNDPVDAYKAIALGADPRTARDLSQATPLMLAAFNDNLNLTHALLHQSDPAAVDDEGWNALFCALHAKSYMSSILLMDHTDLDHLDHQGRHACDICPEDSSEWLSIKAKLLARQERLLLEHTQNPAPRIASAKRV